MELPGGLLALWPFQTAGQVRAWQANQRAAGGDPQHRLDPVATALEFTRGALGFTGIDRVTSATGTADEQFVGVGWQAERGQVLTVATLRLVRFGSGDRAPWVVTGSRDTNVFSRPAYGDVVGSPLEVGGRITGVDEALRVVVTGPGGRTLGTAGPIGVGGVDQPWAATVTLAAVPPAAVLTVVVSTGGHLADVEWFAVTGARLP
jgi:hypothetical protein